MAERTESGVHGIVASAVLVGSVGAILAAGLILSTSTPRNRGLVPPAPAIPIEAPPPAPSDAPPVAPAPAPTLAARAAEDVLRLGASEGRYTAQLLVACKPETVERLLAQAVDERSLYVLPATVKGADCFRVCWGSYATAQDAASAVDLPPALRTQERVGAVEIVKVLP